MSGNGDPTAIRSLAVTVEDVVTALELNRTTGRRAVLRVTPPFSGRMRARLHVADTADEDGPLHVDPESLVSPDAPEYPTAAETEAELRADSEESYTVERHHEYHLDAVAEWRRAVADAIRTCATLETSAGPHEVEISTLGELEADEMPMRDESGL